MGGFEMPPYGSGFRERTMMILTFKNSLNLVSKQKILRQHKHLTQFCKELDSRSQELFSSTHPLSSSIRSALVHSREAGSSLFTLLGTNSFVFIASCTAQTLT